MRYVVILRDAEIQNHTARAGTEAICAILLDITGQFMRHSVATHFADGLYVACVSSWRKTERHAPW